MDLFTACFTKAGKPMVVVLHAKDAKDAAYCVREAHGRIAGLSITNLRTLEVGIVRTIYEGEKPG